VLERSARAERQGKTPAELLTGAAPLHGLERWGCRRFARPAGSTPRQRPWGEPGSTGHKEGPRRHSKTANLLPWKGRFWTRPEVLRAIRRIFSTC